MEQKTIIRYSQAFRQRVIAEIESGRLSKSQAAKVYGLKAPSLVDYWIKRSGKEHLATKVVRIQMKDEYERIRELEKEKKRLESALAQSHLKNLALEELIKVAEEHYKIDIKKNCGSNQSIESSANGNE